MDELLKLAISVARAAGDLLLEFTQRRGLAVTTKSSETDPVSAADRASERLISERLLAARPDDGLVGEEGTARPGASGLRWVVDPLDGTVNYLYGLPQWSVSIAAEDDQGAVIGVVHDPTRGETFAARRGRRATVNGEPLAVSEPRAFEHALIATGFSYDVDLRRVQGLQVADLLTRVRDVRRCGSAALDLAWTAGGRVDGYVEFGLNRWDWIAGDLLVREAGGQTGAWSIDVDDRSRAGLVAGGALVRAGLDDWLAAQRARPEQ